MCIFVAMLKQKNYKITAKRYSDKIIKNCKIQDCMTKYPMY